MQQIPVYAFTGFLDSGKTKFILYSSIASMVLNLMGNVALYYALGFIGPAVSTLLTTLVIAIAQLVFTAKYVSVGFSRIFPWKDMTIRLLQTLLLGGVFWGVKQLLTSVTDEKHSVIVAILLGVVWAAIYALVNRSFIRVNWTALNRERNDSPEEM